MALRQCRVVTAAVAVSAGLAGATQPNIVFILADDMDGDFKQDRLAIMPNLRTQIAEKGARFANHVAAQPVCGPSRASILSGRYPHNVGYYANLDKKSVANWLAQQNNTIGTWLTAAGYHTSFAGKYVNGADEHVPSGWNHWAAFSSSKGTYNYYNATGWDITFDDPGEKPTSEIKERTYTGIHQADLLPEIARQQIRVAQEKGKPFFLHLTPVMMHVGTCYGPFPDDSYYSRDDPYFEHHLQEFGCHPNRDISDCSISASPCVSLRNRGKDDGLRNPHVPSWNRTSTGSLPAAMRSEPLTEYEKHREDMGFRNRTGSARDLDDMIGSVLKALDEAGVADNTYVIFTSDNGYHLGEHRLVFGKEHPYETDVHLPLYIRGPTIKQNVTLLHPSSHLDLTATLVDIAGATPKGPPLDGKSFKGELGGAGGVEEAVAWRDFSFSEHFSKKNTWWQIRRPFAKEDPAGATTFTWWCTGQGEVYDLEKDPWQLTNLADPETPRGKAVQRSQLPLGVFLSTCSGEDCSSPRPAAVPATPLECRHVTGSLSERLARGEGFEYDIAWV